MARTVRCGARDVTIAGGAYTPLAWWRAFRDDDLYKVAVKLERAAHLGDKKPIEDLPTYDVLRLMYALAATAEKAGGSEIEPFDEWVASLGEVNVVEAFAACDACVLEGLFRRHKPQVKGKGRSRSERRADEGDGAGERGKDGDGS